MSKWEFQPESKEVTTENRKELLVRRMDGTKAAKESVFSRVIASTDLTNFELLYNSQNRLCGYRLSYDYTKLFTKGLTFNSCFLAFSDPNKLESPKLEILYEDQAVRLLVYEFTEVTDVWLVGRWREVSAS